MTIIAWDGSTLAADTQACFGEIIMYQKKIHSIDGVIYASCGVMAEGSAMMKWHILGAKPEDFPKTHNSDDISTMLVVATCDSLRSYNGSPHPLDHRFQDCIAFGSGCEFAMAAMECGKNAVEAAEIVCKISVSCGGSVESFTVKPVTVEVVA